MNRNERPFRPLPWRLSSAAWCGIFGQCACCLTESTALIDRERLKRQFSAYWGLSAPLLGIAYSSDRLSAEEQTGIKLQRRPVAEPGVRTNRPSTYRYSDSESPLHA